MKKPIISICASLLICTSAFTQSGAIILGDDIYEDNSIMSSLPIPTNTFNTTNTNNPNDPYDGYDGQKAEFTQNIMSKPNGDVEFFVIDGVVYDKAGQLIDQLQGFGSNGGLVTATGQSELMIVPFPNDCNKYYLIAGAKQNFYTAPSVSVLDMALPNEYAPQGSDCEFFGAISLTDLPENGGSGSAANVLSIENIINNSTSVTGSVLPDFIPNDPSFGKNNGFLLASTKLQSNGSRMLFITNEKGIYSIKIDGSGFNAQDFIPFTGGGFNANSLTTELEVVTLSNGNLRIGGAYYDTEDNDVVYFCDVLQNGTFLANTFNDIPLTVNTNSTFRTGARGIEFSPSGDYLYFTQVKNGVYSHGLRYYNVAAGTGPFNITTNSFQDFQYSFIETGSNGNLLIANEYGLHSLTNAENPNSTINYASQVSLLPSTRGLNLNSSDPGVQFLAELYKVYQLQDQIDDMDYVEMFTQNTQCCIANTSFDNDFYVASSGTWTNTNPVNNTSILQIRKELRVPAGVTLTIENQEIKFAEGARLVIENGTNGTYGGKLILKNTKLSADDRCGDYNWLGVEVWGNVTEEQGLINTTQGRLEMRNNSSIKNAEIAVLLSKRNTSTQNQDLCDVYTQFLNTSFDNTRNGGVVTMLGTKVENCQLGIYARPYTRPNGINNVSYVRKSEFVWSNELNTGLVPRTHIQLDTYKGFSVSGTRFANDYEATGFGVLALRSQFQVHNSCDVSTPSGQSCPPASTTNSTFDNLSVGVYANNILNSLAFSVTDAVFTNNLYGVYVDGTKFERITSNIFTIRESSTVQSAGVVVNSSDQYLISENFFKEYDDPTVAAGDGLSYGVVVRNSGENHNEIYKNNFEHLYVGCQAEKVNGTVIANSNNTLTEGLQFKCNSFDKETYLTDIGVNGRIDYQQGYADPSNEVLARKKAAKNSFSLNHELLVEHDIMVDQGSQVFNYTHLGDANHTPDSYSTLVTPILSTYQGNPVYMTSNGCPSKLNSKFSKLSGDLVVAKEDLENEKKKIENGAHSDRIALINSSQSDYNVYLELNTFSPYLSDNVLSTYINSNRDEQYKVQVLIQNSPLTYDVIQVMEVSGMSQQSQNSVLQVQKGISGRDYCEQSIMFYNSEVRNLSADIIRQSILELEDSEVANKVNNLQFVNSNESNLALLDYHLSSGNTSNYTSLKSQLISYGQLPGFNDLQEIKENLNGVLNLEEELANNTTLTNQIITLAGKFTDNENSFRAEFLLRNGAVVPELIIFLPLTVSKSGKTFNIASNDEREDVAKIIVYPIPSSSNLTVKLTANYYNKNNVVITDMTGRVVLTDSFTDSDELKISVENLTDGMYSLLITNDYGDSEFKIIQVLK